MMESQIEHNTITPDIETSSDGYRQRFSGAVGRFFLDTQIHAIEHVIPSGRWAQCRVLDVGGGHGQLTRFLLDRGYDVWVQGSAETCRQQIEPLVNRFAQRLHLVASSLWSLPFADHVFDMVIAVRVMSHVERWEALLTEMARVTRHRLVIDYAALSSSNILRPLLFCAKRSVEGNTRPFFCYRAGQLSRHLRLLGFSRITLRKQLFVPMGLHRLVKSASVSAAAEATCRAVGLTRLFGSPVILLAERPIGSFRKNTSP
jgi:SAM-dependent methyltransferase